MISDDHRPQLGFYRTRGLYLYNLGIIIVLRFLFFLFFIFNYREPLVVTISCFAINLNPFV